MIFVLCPRSTVNQDVIHKNLEELSEKLAQDCGHHGLERSWGIRQVEGHDDKLKMSKAGPESRFVLVASPYSDLMKALLEVDFRENYHPHETIENLLNARELELILDGHRIQSAVVYAHAEFPVLVLDHKDCCNIRRNRQFYHPRSSMLSNCC